MIEPCACGAGCDCGCCEGTDLLTPRMIANRPGLSALDYRVGTHSSFLETMKARLSSAEHPGLAALTTREASDPAIALLDAWAVVADVLTFYQERIANEGYLCTATERRSVLELARLVGYEPRPGVASSVYLAFTLAAPVEPIRSPAAPTRPVATEERHPETVIPAGARAQTVPGPGELPQPFETTEDLTARADWNDLRVRLTRPQQPGTLTTAMAWPVTLYFRGIATNLAPNDPLLIETGTRSRPVLYRVLQVEPEADEDRTRVEVEPWTREPAAAARVGEPPTLARMVEEIVTRASDLEVHDVSRGATAERVLSRLELLRMAASEEAAESDLRRAVMEARSELAGDLADAQKFRAARLTPWLEGVIEDLTEALAAAAPPLNTASPAGVSPAGSAGTTTIAEVLDALGKPPRRQPRSGRHLARDSASLFGPGSGGAARLLTVARPQLRDVLYAAWANVPATPPPALRVHALRTRASVFGHNTPRELVRRPRDGVILGSKEWDFTRVGDGGREELSIELNFLSPGLQTTIAIGEAAGEDRRTLQTEEFQVRLSTGQSVRAELSAGGEFLLPLRLRLDFEDWGFQIDVNLTFNENRQEVVEVRASTAGLSSVDLVEPVLAGDAPGSIRIEGTVRGSSGSEHTEEADVVWLDAPHPEVLPGSWIVLERPFPSQGIDKLVITRVQRTAERSRADYGLSAKASRIELGEPWLDLGRDTFAVIRGTAVFARNEILELAQAPIDPVAEAVCGRQIELAGLYDGLEPGRWLIVAGERTDVDGPEEAETSEGKQGRVRVAGVPAAELVMIAGVEHGVAGRPVDDRRADLPGEATHTTLTLAVPLAYCYKRDTVTLYGNVAPATHGETRFEVLGSGNGAAAFQAFTLKQPPLTFVSAPTPSGIESTLEVRVNDLLWRQAPSFAGLGPTDRGYVTRTADEGRTTVVFGNGERGARLPTGGENVRATYRTGIGKAGNAKAAQISQLVTRPLGVKDVVNPLPATGGADRESRDQARRNAPLAVTSLDRLVSVQDYEDFARTFAGVGKASAVRLSDGRVQLVHVTIAGEDDIPIGEDSDLVRNLAVALRRFGDPRQPIRLEVRQRSFLIVQAAVKVLADFLWEKVEPRIRTALLEAFGFIRRDLAQDALLAEAVATIQGVRGVDLVDIDVFDTVTGSVDPGELTKQEERLSADQPKRRLRARLARRDPRLGIQPAELIYLTPEVPETIILRERTS